tara:strand:+ start:97 stop:240 length:144 start_codon:yes stop_codon:yes gene_type:complete
MGKMKELAIDLQDNITDEEFKLQCIREQELEMQMHAQDMMMEMQMNN